MVCAIDITMNLSWGIHLSLIPKIPHGPLFWMCGVKNAQEAFKSSIAHYMKNFTLIFCDINSWLIHAPFNSKHNNKTFKTFYSLTWPWIQLVELFLPILCWTSNHTILLCGGSECAHNFQIKIPSQRFDSNYYE